MTAFLWLAATSPPANAQPDNVSADLADFMGMCFRPDFRATLLYDLGAELGWSEIPDGLLGAFAPPRPPLTIRGFIAYGPEADAQPFFAIAWEGTAPSGQRIDACSAFFRFGDGGAFVDDLTSWETVAIIEDQSLRGTRQVYLSVEDIPEMVVAVQYDLEVDGIRATALFERTVP